jgi:aminomethyltransferase
LTEPTAGPLKRTPLHALHKELGARLVPFAGYEMPVQYPTGILVEHAQTRTAAGLFDVSHMGQVRLTAKPGQNAAKALETIVPGDIAGLQPGQQRYTQFTNDAGGILDDLMVTSTGDHLLLVINAACKDADLAHIQKHLSAACEIEPMFSRGLLALQGPQASQALARLVPAAATMTFMTGAFFTIEGAECYVTRSGYTGGDGYEISTPADATDAIARLLLAEPEVLPIGLGARDSLRLEAGLCLYGHDIDETTTPIEADLLWTISKRRRAEGGFPGAPSSRSRSPKAPRASASASSPRAAPRARGHRDCHRRQDRRPHHQRRLRPTPDAPVAMGYVEPPRPQSGTAKVDLMVRGKPAARPIVPCLSFRTVTSRSNYRG